MKQPISYILIIVTLLMSNVVYAEPVKRQVTFTKIEQNKDNKGHIYIPFSLTIPPSGNLNGNTLYIEFNSEASLAEVTIYKNEAVISHDVESISDADDSTTYDLGQYGGGEYMVVIEFSDCSSYEAEFEIE